MGSLRQVSCKDADRIDVVETLVRLSSCMDDKPNIVLPEPKMEELIEEVRTAYDK